MKFLKDMQIFWKDKMIASCVIPSLKTMKGIWSCRESKKKFRRWQFVWIC